MKRGLMCAAILAIMSLSFISAVATTVSIDTVPSHEIQIAFIEDDSEVSVLENLKGYSGPDGKVSFTYKGMDDSFRFILFVRKDGNTIFMKKFTKGYDAGEDICFKFTADSQKQVECPEKKEVVPEVVEVVEEEVIEEVANETPSEENETEKGAAVTGFTISDATKYVNNSYFYGGAGLAACLVAGMLFVKHRRKNKKSIIPSLSNFGSKGPDSLDAAERRLKKAQDDLDRFKNKDKISKLKEEIIAKEKEILKLRK